MNTRKLLFVVGVALLLAAAAWVAWELNAPQPAAAQGGEGECTGEPCPEWIVEAWAGSGHADATAQAFRHWDEADPKEVPVVCAKCHSETGYLDYLGADGTAAGVVDNPAPVDTLVSCTVCHNPVATTKETAVFPSGIELTDLGPAARCMECHQGLASTVQVNNKIAEVGVGPDEVSADLNFINIHYFAAAASMLGAEAQGGYQYAGQAYQPRLAHVAEFDTCNECHNPHSLEVQVEQCAICHVGVTSVEDLKTVRLPGSLVDYDGDGNLDEGIHEELEGLHALLYQAIQAYSRDVISAPVVYDAGTYPYFFNDINGNGSLDADEAAFDNAYASFTPRLLQAAYNFQFYKKDPGAFAHNPRYHAQLMVDSVASLNEVLPQAVDLTLVHRNPSGHFDGSSEAFRHWDAEGEVAAGCVKCHTAEGLPMFLKNNATIAIEPSVSLTCSSCHASLADFSLYEVTEVKFPSGALLGFGDDLASNLCLNCHQGRESTPSVNAAIARIGVADDEASPDLSFRNVHYFAAGASLFGSEAQGAYQYEGKEYRGRFLHVPGALETCASCHDPHILKLDVTLCTGCHVGVTDVHQIRMASGDFDGDAADEGVAGEIETIHAALLVAIQDYATNTAGASIAYNPTAYPYWYQDTNANGVVDPEETERYASWTPRLLRAAYNYQYVAKDPGAFAHNAQYVVQILYDSLEDIAGAEAVAGFTRP